MRYWIHSIAILAFMLATGLQSSVSHAMAHDVVTHSEHAPDFHASDAVSHHGMEQDDGALLVEVTTPQGKRKQEDCGSGKKASPTKPVETIVYKHYGDGHYGDGQAGYSLDQSCDQGQCQCAFGNCHGVSGLSAMTGAVEAAFSSSEIEFVFQDRFSQPAVLDLLKRPPRI